MDVLVAVDVQHDFMPGGRVPVEGGADIVAPLVAFARRLRATGGVTIASRDWHPNDHCSFRENGGEWAHHCVAGSIGAMVNHLLDAQADYVVSKGQDPAREEYSAADACEVVLAGLAAYGEVERVYVAGLALDYCVKATALGLAEGGWEVAVLVDLTAAVDETRAAEVCDELAAAGVRVMTEEDARAEIEPKARA